MQNNTPKSIMLVLGMHRSGTSLISRSLKIFGAEHGQRLLSITLGNAKGHWEDEDFYHLNNTMLKALGKPWDSPLPITKAETEALLKAYANDAKSLLNSRLQETNCFALKEPRITKLIDFWLQIFSNCNLKIHYVYALRNPFSVAKSLHKRSNMPIESGLLLWYSYNAYALKSLQDKSMVFIDYDDFLINPEKYLEKMSSSFNLPQNANDCAEFLQSFLDKNMRSFEADNLEQCSDIERVYLKFYKKILRNCTKNQLPNHFFNDYHQDIIYTTLQRMVLQN